jgi:hypothetical protein
MTLLIQEIVHLLVGTALGLLVARVGKWRGVLSWALLSSLLIDVDHIVDYLWTVGPHWDARALTTGSYFASSGRVMVLLHSWELAVVMVVIGLIVGDKKYSVPLLGLGVGMIGHLFVDQIWYKQPWATYFLVVRWLHGFADPRYW